MTEDLKPITSERESMESPKKTKTKFDVIFIRIPSDLKERLDIQAERLNMTRNSLVRLAIVGWVEKEEHVQRVREMEVMSPSERLREEKVVTLINPLS